MRTPFTLLLAGIMLIAGTGDGWAAKKKKTKPRPAHPPAASHAHARAPMPAAPAASIGNATMAADGTITMHLRGDVEGAIAETVETVKPTDADYTDVKTHLGRISPGQRVPVPPYGN